MRLGLMEFLRNAPRRWVAVVVAACVLVTVLWSGPAGAQQASGNRVTRQDIELRDELIAAQESLLNVYRCRFNVDSQVVPGGCRDGQPRRGQVTPGMFSGTPSTREAALRDDLIAEQELLLNTYRCRFGIDTSVVIGGCEAFHVRQMRQHVASDVLERANELRDGLTPLKINAALSSAAQSKAQAQAEAMDWLYAFDVRALLAPDWLLWEFEGSRRIEASADQTGIHEVLAQLLASNYADILRCEPCTHMGLGLASQHGWIYATVIVATPTEGKRNVWVYHCAQAGKFSTAELRDEVRHLNSTLTDYYLRESSGLATVEFLVGGTISPSIDWGDSNKNSLNNWHATIRSSQGRQRDPCESNIPDESRNRHVLVLADVGHDNSVWGYANWSYGIVPMFNRFRFNETRPIYDALVAHEIGHSVFDLKHTRDDVPKYPCTATWPLMDWRSCSGVTAATALKNAEVDCEQRRRLNWPCGSSATEEKGNDNRASVTLRQTDVDAVHEGRCSNSCTWQAVRVTGFTPGNYVVECWSHNNPDARPRKYREFSIVVESDGTGANSRVCFNGYYDDVADYSASVYVVVGGMKSNTITLRRPTSPHL